MQPPTPSPQPEVTPGRRDFLKKALAVITGGLATLIPGLGSLVMVLNPLKSTTASARKALRVASLTALPPDGVPRKFAVIASRTDVWNRLPESPIGAVYLRRTDASTVQAFNVTCPHAGCFVEYLPERKQYLCPCHNSTFALSGARAPGNSPSPRGLDELKVEIRNNEEVWIEFQNFLTGHAEKIVQS